MLEFTLERPIADLQHGSMWLGLYISIRAVDKIYYTIFSIFACVQTIKVVIDDDCWDYNLPFSNFSATQVFLCSVNYQIYGGENDRVRPTAAVRGN